MQRYFTTIQAPRKLPDTCTVFPRLPLFLLQDPHHSICTCKYTKKNGSLSDQEPQQCLDLCAEIALRYGVVVILFKYTNSVCALVFNLEDDVDETENHSAFINAVVMEMRNRIA